MTSVIDKIRKRRCYPVPIENGETLHVQPLRWTERLLADSLPELEDKIVFRLCMSLVEENGDRSFPLGDKESPAEYVARLRETTTALTYEDVKALSDAIAKVTKTPDPETVRKNSEPTAAAAS